MNVRLNVRSYAWPSAAVALLLGQVLLIVVTEADSRLASYTLEYFPLLVLATAGGCQLSSNPEEQPFILGVPLSRHSVVDSGYVARSTFSIELFGEISPAGYAVFCRHFGLFAIL